MISLNKLGLIAAGGFTACLAMFFAFKQKVSDTLKKSPVYVEAMKALREDKGAILLLGQPIQESSAKFASAGDESKKQLDMQVYVSGPKANGILFYSSKQGNDNKAYLDTVHLQIGKDDSKRLVIKNSLDEMSSKS